MVFVRWKSYKNTIECTDHDHFKGINVTSKTPISYEYFVEVICNMPGDVFHISANSLLQLNIDYGTIIKQQYKLYVYTFSQLVFAP